MNNYKESERKTDRQVYITGDLSKRYSGLHLTKITLKMIDSVMENYKHILKNPENDRDLYFIMWAGIIIRFTSCFSSDQSRTKLNSSKIYNETNGLRESYKIIDDIRDKNIAHDVNSMYDDKAIINLDSSNSVITTLPVAVLGAMRSDIYGIMVKLVKTAISSVQSEMDKCRENLIIEVQAMTPEQRAALPPWSYDAAAGMMNFKDPRRR